MHIFMSSQQRYLVYALWQEEPKLVYTFWTCKPVISSSIISGQNWLLTVVCLIKSADRLERGLDVKNSPFLMVPTMEQLPVSPFGDGLEVGKKPVEHARYATINSRLL